MLMVEDFNLNSIQGHPNSVEVLRQTMLSQEDIFREQVHELHRLYETQKNMMANLDRKQLDDYNFWRERAKTTLGWLRSPAHNPFLANERQISTFPMVGSSQCAVSKDFWDVNHSVHSRLQQRPWDLKSPVDERYHVAYPEKVDLSLSIGGKAMKKDVDKGFGNPKNCQIKGSSFHHVIVLEESMDTQYNNNEDVGSASTSSSIALVYNQGSQASVQSNQVSPQHSLKDGSESYEEQNSSNQAFNVPNKMQTPISEKVTRFDLNISQFDESLSLNDSVPSLSTAGSSGGFDGSVSKIFLLNSPLGSGKSLNKSPDKDHIVVTTSEVTEQKDELAENNDDALVRKAAESLLHFSLRSPSIEDRVESSVIEDQPQYSMDSFEEMALKMTECNLDDDVTSKTYQPSEFDKNKDCGVKLRRGRRLKDFQKDVLPTLSTLASHEIREDLQIMETVIRSREYKRMRSKTVNGGDWFVPVKSKRSRLNTGSRRSSW